MKYFFRITLLCVSLGNMYGALQENPDFVIANPWLPIKYHILGRSLYRSLYRREYLVHYGFAFINKVVERLLKIEEEESSYSERSKNVHYALVTITRALWWHGYKRGMQHDLAQLEARALEGLVRFLENDLKKRDDYDSVIDIRDKKAAYIYLKEIADERNKLYEQRLAQRANKIKAMRELDGCCGPCFAWVLGQFLEVPKK